MRHLCVHLCMHIATWYENAVQIWYEYAVAVWTAMKWLTRFYEMTI